MAPWDQRHLPSPPDMDDHPVEEVLENVKESVVEASNAVATAATTHAHAAALRVQTLHDKLTEDIAPYMSDLPDWAAPLTVSAVLYLLPLLLITCCVCVILRCVAHRHALRRAQRKQDAWEKSWFAFATHGAPGGARAGMGWGDRGDLKCFAPPRTAQLCGVWSVPSPCPPPRRHALPDALPPSPCRSVDEGHRWPRENDGSSGPQGAHRMGRDGRGPVEGSAQELVREAESEPEPSNARSTAPRSSPRIT